MEQYKVVYVDEVQEELKEYSQKLSIGKKLKIVSLEPKPNLEINELVREDPQLVLIDYRLTRTVSYLGGTLATKVREELPEIPIVLITRKALLGPKYYKGAPGQLGSVNYIIYKDDIDIDMTGCIKELIDLILGFQKLRNTKKRNWNSLLRLLGANETEAEILKEIPPGPYASEKIVEKWKWTASDVAKWIMDTLFKYPGIFYDELYASTALGISVQSFRRPEILKLINEAAYEGVFSGLRHLWWKNRLLQIGLNIINKAGLKPPLSRSFSNAIRKLYGLDLTPSYCVYSGEKYADTVCYILKKPVKREYTLAYFPDNRPQIMEPARVSFKAIREDIRVQDELFDFEGRRLLRLIRK